jgi:cupin 2 domain-containing protein
MSGGGEPLLPPGVRAGSLFEGPVPSVEEREAIELLLQTPEVAIERIVSAGHRTPNGIWLDQDSDEWVGLLTGEARLEFEDGTAFPMQPGRWVYLPRHCRHRVERTSADPPCIWLAVQLHR